MINEDDLKATVSFDFIDNDSAFVSGNIVVVDKNNKQLLIMLLKVEKIN